jgi:hypothetical protein
MTRCQLAFVAAVPVWLLIALCVSPGARAVADDAAEQRTVVAGVVSDVQGAPATGARVQVRYHGGPSETTTGSDGRFSVEVPSTRVRGAIVVAEADAGRLMDHHQLPWDPGNDGAKVVELTLKPSQQITVDVADGSGEPISDARTGLLAGSQKWPSMLTDESGRAVHFVPQEIEIQTVYALKTGTGVDYRTLYDPRKARQGEPPDEINLSESFRFTLADPITVEVTLVDAQNGEPIADTKVYPWLLQKPGETSDLNLSFLTDEIAGTTDASGVARFDWLPSWNERQSITFWPSNENYVRQRGNYEPGNVSGSLTIPLHRLVSLSGQVRLPDGRPAVGITIQARGEGYTFDSFHGVATTDEEGRYEIPAAPNLIYLLVVEDQEWAAAPQTGFAVQPGQPRDDLDFELRPATRIYGRVSVGPQQEPIASQLIQSYQSGADLHNTEGLSLPNPDDDRKWVQPSFVRSTRTNEQGRFELFVGPGQYDLRGPSQTEVVKFTITDETEKEINFHAPRPEKGRLSGLIVSGDPPRPVPQARIEGIYRASLAGRDLDITADEEGRFDVQRDLHRTVLRARSPDGTLAGVVEIGPDEKEVTIPIAPMASAKGILLDAVTREPLPGREIVYGVRVPIGDDDAPWRTSFGGEVMTSTDGSFGLERLIVGQPYEINVTNEDGRSWRRIHQHQPESPGEVDFGEVRLEPPYRPPTMQERIAEAFTDSKRSARERYESVLRDAKLGTLRVLLIFADPGDAATEELFRLRYEDRDVRNALYDYRVLVLPTSGETSTEALALAAELGITFEGDRKTPRLVVFSAGEDQLASVSVEAFRSGDAIDVEELVAFLQQHRLPPLNAQQLLDAALAQAKAENKRVFVQETASWCGPCWLLSRFIDDHRETFEKDFIHVKMDHRWTGVGDVMDGIEPDQRGGIPWFAILDAEGKVLADSNGQDGNIGYPAAGEPEGIQHFLMMLRASAIRLTADDLTAIEEALKSR